MSEPETVPVPLEVARRLSEYQHRMAESLELLTSETRLEQERTIIVQQAMLIQTVERLHNDLEQTGAKLEQAVARLSSAFWNLMKVPVACMVIGVASWAYLYSKVISENTWLIMLAVAVFPWLGDSITAVTQIFRGGGGGKTDASK
jgi:hypothetical protein